ncbi:hypothetical protein [Snuella lapsa]|uniref:hypothetical protein n=1 Tax=Snuella lapsa TaxID=870481 RepID=UPI0031E6C2CB
MKYLKHFFIVITILLFLNCNKTNSSQNHTPSILAYYVPDNKIHPKDLPLDKLTHIVFSFTKIVDNEMVFTNDAYDKNFVSLFPKGKNTPT